MTPAFVIFAAVVTLIMVGASVWISRRGGAVDEAAAAASKLEPAPWEREGGEDLSTPVAPVEAAVSAPATIQAPAGARYRSASGEEVNGQIVEEIARGLEKIPPLPRALHLILRELNNAGSSAKSVAGIVGTEQVLSAALLRVVNSAASGLRREVLTVDQAVSYLGFSTVRSLVVRLQMGGLMPSRAGAGGTYDPEKLWMHSVATSQVAEHLAVRVRNVDPWLASTIGLLHDIGKLAINSQFPQQVKKLWDRTGVAADESFLARERRLFGADHAFLGAYLTTRWQLPNELTEAIRLHHLPAGESSGALRPEVFRALCISHVANQLVKYSQVYCEDMEIDIVRPELLTSLGLPELLEDLLDARVKEVIARATKLGAAASNTDGDGKNRKVARVA